MKLPLLTIRALAGELNTLFQGRKVTAVGRLEHGAGLCLSIGPENRSDRLVMSTRPQLFAPFLCRSLELKTEPEPSGSPLETHLRGCTLRSAALWRHDRIIRLEFERADEIRGHIRRVLILELVPRRQNIILLETERQTVLFALRRVDRQISRVRQVLPGRLYQPPPLSPGLHPGADSMERFLDAFGQAAGKTLREQFSRLFPWSSPYLCDEILAASGFSPDDRELSVEALRRLWNDLGTWIALLDQGPRSPTMILDDQHRPSWLLPYDPGTVPGERKQGFDRLSQALEELFRRRIGAAAREDRRSVLLARINLVLHRRRRARKHLDRDLEQARLADRYHRSGLILTSNLGRLKKARDRVNLADPADPSSRMEITLDPRLTPAENAQRYFKRARKARAALPQVRTRILRLDEQIKKLTGLRQDLSRTFDEKGLQAVRARLKGLDSEPSMAARAGRSAVHPVDRSQAGHGSAAQRAVGRSYTLPDGWVVLVGRNNKENDELTHRVARPDDLWLHAQGVPGSHVVIRRAGRKDLPGRRITELAAGLAAHFSRARHSGTVPVIITEKRHVRKPRGAKPGTAAVEREKTLFVEPLSPERLREELDK